MLIRVNDHSTAQDNNTYRGNEARIEIQGEPSVAGIRRRQTDNPNKGWKLWKKSQSVGSSKKPVFALIILLLTFILFLIHFGSSYLIIKDMLNAKGNNMSNHTFFAAFKQLYNVSTHSDVKKVPKIYNSLSQKNIPLEQPIPHVNLSLSDTLPKIALPKADSSLYQKENPKDVIEYILNHAQGSAGKNTIIIGLVSNNEVKGGFNFADLWVDQFVCSLTRVGLGDHYLLISVDNSSSAFLKQRQYNFIDYYRFLTQEETNRYPLTEWLHFLFLKPLLASKVLQLGYNVVWADLDVIFLRNPMSKFDDETQNCDAFFSSEGGSTANTGFYFVRSNEKSIQAFQLWTEQCLHLAKGQHDQDAFNAHVHQWEEQVGFKRSVYNMLDFPNGCYLRAGKHPIRNKSYTAHINCMWGAREKVVFSKGRGMWYVTDTNECVAP